MKQRRVKIQESIQYSFTPNHRHTMQALARCRLSSQESRIIMALLNQTDGYLRPKDAIKTSFWQAITLMSRQSVHQTLEGLVRRGIVNREMQDGRVFYSLKHPNDWPRDIFAPQCLSRRALREARQLLAKEKLPKDFAWLSKLLEECEKRLQPTTVLKSVFNQRRFPKKRLQPATVRLQPATVSDSEKPTDSTIDSSTIDSSTTTSRSRPVKESSDPRVRVILDMLTAELGYPLPNIPRCAAEIKKALGMGYSVEEFMGCWRTMREFGFWQGKWLPLIKVVENLGEYRAGRLTEGNRPAWAGKRPVRAEAPTDRSVYDKPW